MFALGMRGTSWENIDLTFRQNFCWWLSWREGECPKHKTPLNSYKNIGRGEKG